MALISKKQRNFRSRTALQNIDRFFIKKRPVLSRSAWETALILIFMESKLDILEKGWYNLDVKLAFH